MLDESPVISKSTTQDHNNLVGPLNVDCSLLAIGSIMGKIKIYKFIESEKNSGRGQNDNFDSYHDILEDYMTIQLKGFSNALDFSINHHLAYNSTNALKVVDIVKPSVILNSLTCDHLICSIKYLSTNTILLGNRMGICVIFDTRLPSKVIKTQPESDMRYIFCHKSIPESFFIANYAGHIYKYDMRSLSLQDVFDGPVTKRLAYAGFIDDDLMISSEDGILTCLNVQSHNTNHLTVGRRNFHQNNINPMSSMKHQFQYRFTPAVPVSNNSKICLFSVVFHIDSPTTYYHIIEVKSSNVKRDGDLINDDFHENHASSPLILSTIKEDIEFNSVLANPAYSSSIGKSNLILVGYVGVNATLYYFDENDSTVKPLRSLEDTSTASCLAYI